MELFTHKRQWPPKTHERLAKEMTVNALIQKKYSGKKDINLYNFITQKNDIEDDNVMETLVNKFKSTIENDKIYETNRIRDTVYYNFMVPLADEQSDNGKQHRPVIKDVYNSDPYSGYIIRLYFLLVMRQRIRILKRLFNFTYFRQNKEEEVTHLNNKTNTIFHPFYDDNKLDVRTSNRIASNMNLQDYIYKSLSMPLIVNVVLNEDEDEKIKESDTTIIKEFNPLTTSTPHKGIIPK